MYYISAIDPNKTIEDDGYFITLMHNSSIENLIEKFIKECIIRTKGEEILEFLGEYVLSEENNCIGIMKWGISKITNKPVLVILREDRENNVYFYSTQGKLLKHDTHQ